ncbi:MAG: T9SS type A sorting domain-containing protein [bacterium]|nr:T9SS type A sorting domain-containing protein [bacterium]
MMVVGTTVSATLLGNGVPITGEWEQHVFTLGVWAQSLEILTQDITNVSTMWVDDVQIFINDSITTIPGRVDSSALQLQQNIPNPFNPATTILFEVTEQSRLSLMIYDVAGRLIDVLIEGDIVDAGAYAEVWGGRDIRGLEAPSGVYFYRLVTDDFTATRRMTLSR